MNTPLAALLLALTATFSSTLQATPLEEVHRLPVSRLEFGSFKLETALTGIKDWPFPIDGAGVSFDVNPDRIEIVVAVKIASAEPFRTACARTLTRVREFLYVDAKGVAPMGRSYLGSYFRGPWVGPQRETALRTLDASTLIRIDVIKRGSCRAALVKAPITFHAAPPN
ncbi:MAG: hypothetical protein IH604_18920 [Burkholderiales bacterium]|nr:hypothetical protein [Burkholderiales bacterium]